MLLQILVDAMSKSVISLARSNVILFTSGTGSWPTIHKGTWSGGGSRRRIPASRIVPSSSAFVPNDKGASMTQNRAQLAHLLKIVHPAVVRGRKTAENFKYVTMLINHTFISLWWDSFLLWTVLKSSEFSFENVSLVVLEILIISPKDWSCPLWICWNSRGLEVRKRQNCQRKLWKGCCVEG